MTVSPQRAACHQFFLYYLGLARVHFFITDKSNILTKSTATTVWGYQTTDQAVSCTRILSLPYHLYAGINV